MAHFSESEKKLSVKYVGESLEQKNKQADVWFLRFPYFLSEAAIPDKDDLFTKINGFIETRSDNSTIVILTSPIFASLLLSKLEKGVNFKLWVGIKLKTKIGSEGKLDQHHAAMLILTHYSGSLKHTKTRIGYTYCPHCNKTTKDYGGKKHLYHEFGTLMSDVWRDIELELDGDGGEIIERLSDLFAINEYKALKWVDLRNHHSPLEVNVNPEIPDRQINDFSYLGNSASQIINGDCLEVLTNIPDNSVDFCFADPPYNVDKKYENWDDALDIVKYFDWCDSWLSELSRIIKPGKTVAILNIPQWAVRHFITLNSQLTFQDWILWEGLSLPVRMIMPAHYSILCFTKGSARALPGMGNQLESYDNATDLLTMKENFCSRASCINSRRKTGVSDKTNISNLWWDIHRLKHNSRRVDHPTQLPPTFMRRLIALFTHEGEFVLDPFNGSGTTSLSAAMLGREYFGIELSEKYYNISKRRHDEIAMGLDPFRKQTNTPISKNSRVKRLEKQEYIVPKKTLQLDVKRIAHKISKTPTREDVIEHSKYPIEYFDNYFINWGEVTAAVRSTGMAQVENKNDYERQINLFKDEKKKNDPK